MLPLVFHLAPGAGRACGWSACRSPWLLLGVLVYPWLLLLGWRYVRRAEANERDFADLVDDEDAA